MSRRKNLRGSVRLSEGFKIVRNQLNIRTGSGQPAPTLRNLSTKTGKVDLLPGGVPRNSSSSVEAAKEGTGFAIKSSDANRWFELLQHQLYRCGYKPGDDIRRWKLVVNNERFFVEGEDSLVLSLGAPEHLRALAKMAIELFALRWRVEVHDPRLAQVRDFVRHGSASNCVMWDYENLPPLPFQPAELGPAYHSIFVWSMGPGEPLAAAVTLFGGYCWTVELASKWWVTPFAFAHAVDPMAERIIGDPQGVDTIPNLRLPLDWTNKRQLTPEAVEQHTASLFTLWYGMQKDKHTQNIIHRVVDQVVQREGWKDGEPWRDEMAALIADPMAHEYMRFKTRSPQVEPLDTEALYRRIEAEYPAFYASKRAKGTR